MDYVGSIYRPPSEASSLLLQVTVGCSHNRCTFCAMYQGKRFRVKPFERVAADLAEAAAIGPRFDRVFLCDGDALILSPRRLGRILTAIRTTLPWVTRVGVYGDARSILRKSLADLQALRDLGLGIVYHGLESGDDPTLRALCKGSTAAEAAEAGRRVRAAGLAYSAIVLLGAGGTVRSAEHIAATAELLNAIQPDFVGALMLTPVPGTPLHAALRAGQFELPDEWGLLRELRDLLRALRLQHGRFSANHASNYLPLRGDMPADRQPLIDLVEHVLDRRDPGLIKPEFLRGL